MIKRYDIRPRRKKASAGAATDDATSAMLAGDGDELEPVGTDIE
jgi:hypothetical protein